MASPSLPKAWGARVEATRWSPPLLPLRTSLPPLGPAKSSTPLPLMPSLPDPGRTSWGVLVALSCAAPAIDAPVAPPGEAFLGGAGDVVVLAPAVGAVVGELVEVDGEAVGARG